MYKYIKAGVGQINCYLFSSYSVGLYAKKICSLADACLQQQWKAVGELEAGEAAGKTANVGQSLQSAVTVTATPHQCGGGGLVQC